MLTVFPIGFAPQFLKINAVLHENAAELADVLRKISNLDLKVYERLDLGGYKLSGAGW